MTNALQRMLSERDWILADGATGTNLFNMGLSSGDAPEMWNVEEPEKIKALYRGAVDAGLVHDIHRLRHTDRRCPAGSIADGSGAEIPGN